jgi:hypothetical protein
MGEGLLYDTATLSKSNEKQIVETEATLIPLTHIHSHSQTDTSNTHT